MPIFSFQSSISSFRCMSESGLLGTRMTRQPNKLLDQVRDAVHLKHCAHSAEKPYTYWLVEGRMPISYGPEAVCSTISRGDPKHLQ